MSNAIIESIRARAAASQSTSLRSIPVGYGRIVCFDRDSAVIGRINAPFADVLERFNALTAGDAPENFGYATMYGWAEPNKRIGYHTYKGVTQFDAEEAQILVDSIPPTEAPPKTKPKSNNRRSK
jgi:hypothetical protein